MIHTSAPGKLIISGEYAVLDGAPALVAAIERRASCQLNQYDYWQFTSNGFNAPSSRYSTQEFSSAKPPAGDAGLLAWYNYQVLDSQMTPVKMHIDTTAFYTQEKKYGFGSSAATSVAICGALARHSKVEVNFSSALKAHRNFQGGKGSGADVAAAYFGGCIHYQNDEAKTYHLLENMDWLCVWTGSSANTNAHINQFEDWLSRGNVEPFDNLKAASAKLIGARNFLAAMADYIQTLDDLDAAAKLNIYTPAHRQLADLAAELDLLYKPSGAGGGDLGILMSVDPEQTLLFSNRASELGFQPMAMPFALEGLRIES